MLLKGALEKNENNTTGQIIDNCLLIILNISIGTPQKRLPWTFYQSSIVTIIRRYDQDFMLIAPNA